LLQYYICEILKSMSTSNSLSVNAQKGFTLSSSKGFAPLILLIGILIIGLAAVGGYYLYQKQTSYPIPQVVQKTPQPKLTKSTSSAQTANWKTYADTKYGYQVQYPADWDLTVLVPGGFSIGGNALGYNGRNFLFSVSILPNTIWDKAEKFPDMVNSNHVVEDVTISGIKGLKKIGDPNLPGPGFQILLSKNNFTYELTGFDNLYKEDKDNSTVDQILSSFKFTN